MAQPLAISSEEQEQLRELARTTRDAKTAVRVRVILALAGGYERQQVAELFLLDEDTITKWRRRYEKRTLFSDWLATRSKGSKGKLTRAQRRELTAFVEAGTITNAAEVVEHVRATYGVTYTVDGVTKLLHRLGFVHKQATLVPGKLDEAKQAAFVKDIKALEEALPADEVVLYGDVVHPTWNVHTTRVWVRRGQEKQLRTSAGSQHMNISGALNMATMRTVMHYTDPLKGVNFAETIKWFDAIQAEYRSEARIHLVLDNASYYKKAWTAYSQRPDCRIAVRWLPAYSPNLNFIERLWHYMRKDIIGVKHRGTFGEFDADIRAFFNNIGGYETTLRKFIGTEPHMIHLA
jgi:transposase